MVISRGDIHKRFSVIVSVGISRVLACTVKTIRTEMNENSESGEN